MNSANWPAVSLSLYWSTLAAVMVNNGFSEANGSLRKPLPSTLPAVVGKPPVQAGMLPSVLPALIEPIGVRLVPNWAAWSAGTLAMTEVASSVNARAPVCRSVLVVFSL
ncbi:hypothetical protein D9M71_700570 [compost metagenome]